MKALIVCYHRLSPLLPRISIVAVLPFLAILLFVTVLPFSAGTAADPANPVPTKPLPDWYSRLSPVAPGAVPPPRSYNATYLITFGGLQAGQVDAQIASPSEGPEIRTSVKAATTGVARTLFKLDATHLSVVDRHTYRPEYLEQTERQSSKSFSTRVDFTADGATRQSRDLNKSESADTNFHKVRKFPYPDLFDMEGIFLYLRSQPLADGDERTLLLMTSGSPYLVTVKVVGHNVAQVKAGSFPSIECSLKLEKVNKSGELEPRKGFKSAEAWISDDSNRLLVKAQSEIFIGAVGLELEKVTFSSGTR